MAVKSYRDLKVWQSATDLVVQCYRLTKLLPKDEIFGLTAQIRRAAVSIPANVAEGHGREHLGDYLHHLSIANGSLMELESHLVVTQRLEYLKEREIAPVLALSGDVSRMLSGLIKALKKRTLTPST